jgi:hypothetical protein
MILGMGKSGQVDGSTLRGLYFGFASTSMRTTLIDLLSGPAL